jgi:hypothetical protein
MALLYPQPVTFYQTGDNEEGPSFNNFLDALDSSFCTSDGETIQPKMEFILTMLLADGMVPKTAMEKTQLISYLHHVVTTKLT